MIKLFPFSLLALVVTLSFPAFSRTTLDNYLQNKHLKVKPLTNTAFIKPTDAKTIKTFINQTFRINSLKKGNYFKVIKDNYKTANNTQYKLTSLPEMIIQLKSDGENIYPKSTAFVVNSHPQWEWQISAGKIWQEHNPLDLTKIVLPFALQERNANCTHNGYIVLAQSTQNPDKSWHGYVQITAETCAYLQFDYAAHLSVEASIAQENFRTPSALTKPIFKLVDLEKDFPKLNVQELLPINPKTNTTSGLVIKGKHYQINCANRMGDDPYCSQLVLPSYSTAKSIYAGTALMRLEKLYPSISQVSVSKIIPQCDGERWKNVSLADLIHMRTGNYLSKKPHVDENSKRMLDFFLAETHQHKLKMACTMFKHKSKAGKHFVYHSSDTYLAGVIMNKLFRQFSKKDDLFTDLMLNDLWQDLTLSDLFANSKRTYDDAQQTFTGWGLSYYVSDLIQLIEFLNTQSKHTTLLDKSMLNSALQIGENRFNRDGGEANMAYNYGFWALEVGHSLQCKKQKWLPFMSGFGGITIVMYQPDIFYYSFADDHQYRWLKVVKALNKQFPLCEDD